MRGFRHDGIPLKQLQGVQAFKSRAIQILSLDSRYPSKLPNTHTLICISLGRILSSKAPLCQFLSTTMENDGNRARRKELVRVSPHVRQPSPLGGGPPFPKTI
jgi:hypothetical protein